MTDHTSSGPCKQEEKEAKIQAMTSGTNTGSVQDTNPDTRCGMGRFISLGPDKLATLGCKPSTVDSQRGSGK